jgi:hypothetical protein
VFLRPIVVADPWHQAQSRAALPRPPAEHPALAHLICAVRLLLLLPLAVCIGAALVVAPVLAAAWMIARLPLRGHEGLGPD